MHCFHCMESIHSQGDLEQCLFDLVASVHTCQSIYLLSKHSWTMPTGCCNASSSVAACNWAELLLRSPRHNLKSILHVVCDEF